MVYNNNRQANYFCPNAGQDYRSGAIRTFNNLVPTELYVGVLVSQ